MRAIGLGLLAIVIGCGPASVSGEVAGTAIDSSDAIFDSGSFLGNDLLSVVVGGPSSDLCVDMAAGVAHASESFLSLTISKGTIGLGAHAIGSSIGSEGVVSVSAGASKLDTACGDILKQSAKSGTITLTEKTATRVQGSFDLLFGTDHVTGSFDARACAKTGLDLKTCQ
jgi:hypothetical protein